MSAVTSEKKISLNHLYNFTLDTRPIAKKRPRFSTRGNIVRTYDDQDYEKRLYKFLLTQEMKKHSLSNLLEGKINLQIAFYTTIAPSSSKKKKMICEGRGDMRRPDLDNYLKFLLDCMNGVIFRDDSQITKICCEKTYSNAPLVVINLFCKGDNMINEHAKTVSNEIEVGDLDYMIKRANRLGKNGRTVVGVFMQEDREGKHYYFECDAPKNERRSCGC